jgi:hypothetical protein
MAIDDAVTSADFQFHYELGHGEIVGVHGDAKGADQMFYRSASAYHWKIEVYPAEFFDDPLQRNAFMVSLGADLCIAFAHRWASGTGHCARYARKAGIPVIDYGVSTRTEDRP